MKRFFVVFLISLSVTSNCFATHRKDVENASEEAHKFATNFPYQTGILFGESGEVGSAVFLDESTALTCTHTAMLHRKEKQIIVMCDIFDTIRLPTTSIVSFNETLKQIPPGTWSSYKVRSLGKLEETKTPIAQSKKDGEEFFSEAYFKKEIALYTDPEKHVFPGKEILVNEKKYMLHGSDLAVLKLKHLYL